MEQPCDGVVVRWGQLRYFQPHLEETWAFTCNSPPTSASWLNILERLFRDLTVRRFQDGVFRSVPALTKAIEDYAAHHNKNPKPFIWTAQASDILAKVIRANRNFLKAANRKQQYTDAVGRRDARHLGTCTALS